MTEPSNAEKVVDILKRELPGFASMFDAATDTFRVRGAIKFNAYADANPRVFAVYDMEPERIAQQLIDMTRRHVIELVGLEALIVERERIAANVARLEGFENGKHAGFIAGETSGYERGRAVGIQLGRDQALREAFDDE